MFEGALGKNAYYYSPELQRMEDSRTLTRRCRNSGVLLRSSSPEICDALSGLLKENELLTLVVGAGCVELEWAYETEP